MICPILTAGEWVKGSDEPTTVECEKENCAWWWIDACAIKAIPTWVHELTMKREI